MVFFFSSDKWILSLLPEFGDMKNIKIKRNFLTLTEHIWAVCLTDTMMKRLSLSQSYSVSSWKFHWKEDSWWQLHISNKLWHDFIFTLVVLDGNCGLDWWDEVIYSWTPKFFLCKLKWMWNMKSSCDSTLFWTSLGRFFSTIFSIFTSKW